MIDIGLDARALHVRGGAQRYAQNLIGQFKDKDGFRVRLYKHESSFGQWTDRTPLRLLYENIYLPYKTFRDDIDIFHGLKNVVPSISRVPRVVTVHDAIPLREKNNQDPYTWMWGQVWRHYVKKAEKVISVSRSTKEDLVKYLSLDPKKIEVVHEGVSKRFFDTEDGESCKKFLESKGADLSERTFNILFTGTMKPQKNVLRLIKAFEELCKDESNVQLLLAGKEGWKPGYPEDYISSSKYGGRIKSLGFVPDELLPELYAFSDLFVFPSLYEGFGLPPLEAMASGTPVIASNNSSMKEVVGEAGILIDPEKVSESHEAMKKIMGDSSLQKKLASKGRKRAEEFRWENVAEETINVYEEILY